MIIRHIISLWFILVDTGHQWARATNPQVKSVEYLHIAHALGEVHCFSKLYGNRKISSPNIYASQLSTILSMWDLVSHMNIFNSVWKTTDSW